MGIKSWLVRLLGTFSLIFDNYIFSPLAGLHSACMIISQAPASTSCLPPSLRSSIHPLNPIHLPSSLSPTMSNQAAYQETLKAHPLSIEPAHMPTPKPHQLTIKTRAIGINPADAAAQHAGLVYSASAHPVILGFDVAGEVYAVGSGPSVTSRFKIGDRVCAFPIDMGSHGGVESKLAHGAFQLYCVANAELTARIPENVAYSEAAVFPSCLSTAAWALFTKDAMALDLPPVEGAAAPNGQMAVIWGGSSVVGSTAIQMARLAGYSVIATSSELNFDHCRALGAEQVFDYKSASVVEDIVAAGREMGKECAGAFVAYYNDGSTVACSKVVSELSGRNKVVGTVVPPQHPAAEGVASDVTIATSKFSFTSAIERHQQLTPHLPHRLGSSPRLHARRHPPLATMAHGSAR